VIANTAGVDICDGQHCEARPMRLFFSWKVQKILRPNVGADGVRDMQSHNWIPVLPLALLFALSPATSHGQEAIGKATSVRPQAEGSHAGPLSGGSNVYSRETIRTGDSGQADLQFHDHSNLTIGPKSSVRLDKFVYDSNKSAGSVAIEATRGSFRFVTASQGNGVVQVKTPYGTLGIRG